MIIIGCDFHTRYQQIAMANDETGELLLERRLDHQSGEAPGAAPFVFKGAVLDFDFSVLCSTLVVSPASTGSIAIRPSSPFA